MDTGVSMAQRMIAFPMFAVGEGERKNGDENEEDATDGLVANKTVEQNLSGLWFK